MSYSINWHIDGRLEVARLHPANGGAITLRDSESGEEMTLFTNGNQWYSLFCALPKATSFSVGMPSLDGTGSRLERDVAIYTPYLKNLLPQFCPAPVEVGA
jgi:hypothetical protein